MSERPRLRSAVIIPAYNEHDRIGVVLKAVTKSKLADEIIVVSDGSTDDTVAEASKFSGVRVIALEVNQGKGAAMLAGVKSTKADIVAFFDADLIGLQGYHVDLVLRPCVQRLTDMSMGILRGGKFWSDTAQIIAPGLSGQRAIRRQLVLEIPHMEEMRLGVEVSINAYFRRKKLKVRKVILHGVANYHKEKKLGLVKGSRARFQMYGEMASAMLQVRRKRGRAHLSKARYFSATLAQKQKKGWTSDNRSDDSNR